jgi:hypothetical protein
MARGVPDFKGIECLLLIELRSTQDVGSWPHSGFTRLPGSSHSNRSPERRPVSAPSGKRGGLRFGPTRDSHFSRHHTIGAPLLRCLSK